MPFNVEEFRDLIRLLEERPEWRADLRRLVLTDELLALPELVRDLVQAQQRTEVRVGRLEEAVTNLAQAQQRTEVRVGRLEEVVTDLAQAQQRTEARVGRLDEGLESLRMETERRFQELATAQSTLTRHVDDLREAVQTLGERIDTLTTDVGDLKGSDLERRYRERPFAYFGRLVRQAHTLSGDELNRLLDRAIAQRQLDDAEVEEIVWADAIVRGRRREDDREVYLVVEVSWGVGPHDVQRADERARLLAKADVTTLPVVAGVWITPDGEVAARALKVWQVTDGHVVAPEQP
jgi:chromosome segregation ATPase